MVKNSTMCIKVLFIIIPSPPKKECATNGTDFFTPHLFSPFIYKLFTTSSAHVMSKVFSITGSTMSISCRPHGFYFTIVRLLTSPCKLY